MACISVISTSILQTTVYHIQLSPFKVFITSFLHNASFLFIFGTEGVLNFEKKKRDFLLVLKTICTSICLVFFFFFFFFWLSYLLESYLGVGGLGGWIEGFGYFSYLNVAFAPYIAYLQASFLTRYMYLTMQVLGHL